MTRRNTTASFICLALVQGVLLSRLPTAASFAPGSCFPCSELHASAIHHSRMQKRRERPAITSRHVLMQAAENTDPQANLDPCTIKPIQHVDKEEAMRQNRRQMVAAAVLLTAATTATLPAPTTAATAETLKRGNLVQVSDPASYSALAYRPPGAKGKVPLIVVLHGAGKNEQDAWSLADPQGEHAGLAPSLLATARAPEELANNFALVAPYSAGKRSFYEEPRKKVLSFVDWVCSDAGRAAGCGDVDENQVFLFGFSDGATCGVELMTSGRFKAGVFAAYGFTGTLPDLAVKRLKDIPMWIFHSADDVIFPVKCSDKLVSSLRKVQTREVVRYTRFDRDQEGFTGDVQGHSTGITASKTPEIYSWMLSIARGGAEEEGGETEEEEEEDV